MDETHLCPIFAPTIATNADRSATAKQPDASPFDERMRKAIEARVGKADPQMSNMRPGTGPSATKNRS